MNETQARAAMRYLLLTMEATMADHLATSPFCRSSAQNRETMRRFMEREVVVRYYYLNEEIDKMIK